MKAVQTSKFLICAFLIIACTGGIAQEPTSPQLPPGRSGSAKAKDLLEQTVQAGTIPGGTTLGEALDRLLMPMGSWTATVGGRTVNSINWSAAPGADLLPLPAINLGEIKVKDALTKIAEAADAECSTNFSGSGASVFISVSRKPSRDMKRLVYFAFPGWRLEAVLKTMLEGTDTNYVINPRLSNLTVNATLKGVALETAIGAVLKAVGADYSREGSVIYVMPNSAQPQALGNSHMQQAVIQQQIPQMQQMQQMQQTPQMQPNVHSPNASNNTQQQRVISQAVDLKYLDAGEIAPIVTRPGMNVVSTNRNSAVITGPEQDVQQAAKLIAQLDSEKMLPKQIRVKAVVKIVPPRGKNGQPEPLVFTGEKVTTDNQYVEIRDTSKGTFGQADFWISGTLRADNSGQILGSISGRFDCNVTVDSRPYQLNLLLGQNTQLRVRSGATAVIATGTGGPQGSGLPYEVTLTATIEPIKAAAPKAAPQPASKRGK